MQNIFVYKLNKNNKVKPWNRYDEFKIEIFFDIMVSQTTRNPSSKAQDFIQQMSVCLEAEKGL